MRAPLQGRTAVITGGSRGIGWEGVQPTDAPLVSRDHMLDAEAIADAILFAITRPVGVNIDELRLSPA